MNANALLAAVRAALAPSSTEIPAVQVRTDFSAGEMRAANAARDAFRKGRRGPLTPDEQAAYRAYQRATRATRRQAEPVAS